MRFLFTLWISKFAAWFISKISPSRGTNYSGGLALKLMPRFVSAFKNIDLDKVVFLTGSNGKSTCTTLLNQILLAGGKSVACNLEGANMLGGVATTLIKNSDWRGRLKTEYIVLEVDERSYPLIRKQLNAHHMGITNIQKDQACRNSDPDYIFTRMARAMNSDVTLYLSNDDPQSKAFEEYAGKALYYSVEKNEKSRAHAVSYWHTLACPKCGEAIHYSYYNCAGTGPFSCSACAHASEAHPDFILSGISLENASFRLGESECRMPYVAPFHFYNYALTILIARSLGLDDASIRAGIEHFVNFDENSESFSCAGKTIHYLRFKQENPETLQGALDAFADDSSEKALFIGLYPMKNFLPHYTSTVYAYDCDFTEIAQDNVEKYVVFSTPVCYDTVLRMRLAGIPAEKIEVYETDDIPTIVSLVDTVKCDNIYFMTNRHTHSLIKPYILKKGGK